MSWLMSALMSALTSRPMSAAYHHAESTAVIRSSSPSLGCRELRQSEREDSRKTLSDILQAVMVMELLRASWAPLRGPHPGCPLIRAATELNRRGLATPQGGQWHALTVIRLRQRLAITH
jgi:hypothetical protein